MFALASKNRTLKGIWVLHGLAVSVLFITRNITRGNSAVRVIRTRDGRVLACASFSHELKLMINYACQKLSMYVLLADNVGKYKLFSTVYRKAAC